MAIFSAGVRARLGLGAACGVGLTAIAILAAGTLSASRTGRHFTPTPAASIAPTSDASVRNDDSAPAVEPTSATAVALRPAP